MAVSNANIFALVSNATFKKQCLGGILQTARTVLTESPDTDFFQARRDLAKSMLNSPNFDLFMYWLATDPTLIAKSDDPEKIDDALVNAAIATAWNYAAGVDSPGEENAKAAMERSSLDGVIGR